MSAHPEARQREVTGDRTTPDGAEGSTSHEPEGATSDEPEGDPPSPRRRNREEREQRILDAAWHLLATEPGRSFTIGRLAREAGISRPNFYFYFDSLNDVLRALAERVYRELIGEYFPSPDLGVHASIRYTVEVNQQRWAEHASVLRAMARVAEENVNVGDLWAEVGEQGLAESTTVVDQSKSIGMVAAEPSTFALVVAMGDCLWINALQASLRGPGAGGLDDDELIDTLTTIWVRALFVTDDPDAKLRALLGGTAGD